MFMKNVLYKTSILSTLGLFVYALFFAQHAYAITPSQINDRITVNTGNTELALNVRTTANGTITGQQLTGAVGTVIGGPQSVGVHTWWQVNFDSGVDGWVASGFTELISPPTVDIQVNNNNGPVNIEHNSPATISWSSQNATSCTASGAWTGPKSVSGSEVIENLTTSGTFTLTCTGAGGSAADSVTVNATAPPPSTTFSANDRVEVTSGPLNIRSCPGTSCSTLGTQTTGALGTVTGGATYASGYYWWQINFDSGADGWAVENYLAKYTAPPPTSNLPDVIVTALSYSNGSFTATVKNQGSVAVSSGTTIGVGYFVNGTQRTWGSVLGPLAAGASVNIGTQGGSYTIPSGTHTIMAYVDDVNRFAESNENNNQLSQSITIGTATPPSSPTIICEGPVTLYQHDSYEGYSVGFNIGTYTLLQLQACGVTDNDISSIKVPSGYQAVLYDGDNFTGTSITRTTDDDSFTDNAFNDRLTSMSITAVSTPPPPSSTKFSLNDRVEVTSGPLNVRSCAGATCTSPGTQATGIIGTIIGGPTYASNYHWWQVNFDSGVDGWVVEDFLKDYVAPTPGAFSFNGIDTYATIGTEEISASQGTVSAWAKASAFSATNYIFGETTLPSFSNRIQMYTENGLFAVGLGNTHYLATNIQQFSINTWYHVALTWNNGSYAVYVNGTLKNSGSYAGLATLNPIAHTGNTGDANVLQPWNGSIDDVKMWNRALSASEITTEYNSSPNATPPSSPTIICEGPVTLYQHDSYEGYSVGFNIGTYTLLQLQACGVTDNDISSIKVPSGYQAVLYDGDNFTGTSITRTTDDDSFTDNAFNDRLTSMSITAVSTPPPPPTSNLPDVIVTALSYSNGSFTATVKNQGSVAVSSGTTIGVGYFVNGTQRTWGSVLGPLAAGASVNIGTQGGSYTIPSGTHTIMAYVDDVNRFAESNENNNQLSQSITIGTATPPPPPTSASTPDAIVAPSGGDFTNIGTAYSSASCGDLIHVRNGTYTLNSILSLNKNCTNGNEIIIRNYPGENPKIACNNPASSNDVKRVEANGQYNVWDGIEISNCWDGFKVHNSNNQILNSKIHNNIFSGIVISPLNPNISGIVIRGNTLEVNGYAESGNCTVGVATNCIEKTNPTNGQPLSLKNVQQIYFSNSTCNNIVGAQVDNNTIRNFGGRALQFNGLTGGSGSPCSSNGIRNIIFENNTILNGSWGMSFFYGSGNNIIRNNTFALNNWPNTNDSEHTFMGLWGVRDTQITENQFNSNTTVWPIYLSDSTSTCGTNNISSNTWDTNSNTWFYKNPAVRRVLLL